MKESAKLEKKTPKKGVIVLVLLIVIAALCAVGYGVWYQMPEQRFAREMDLGERYLDDLDYEQAVAAFSTALSIQPDNAKAEEALSGAYVSWSDSYVSAGDYPSAVDTLEQGQAALPDNTAITDTLAQTYVSWSTSYVTAGDYRSAVDTLHEGQSVLSDNTSITDSLTDTYLAWVDALLSAGDLEQAQAVIAEAQEVVPGDAVTEKDAEVQQKVQEQEIIKAADTAIQSVPEELTEDIPNPGESTYEEVSGGYKAICDWFAEVREELVSLIGEDKDSYIDSDNGFGLYLLNSGQYGLYIGEFNGENREGTGRWLVFDGEDADGGRILYYQGTWNGDAPNGAMTTWFEGGADTVHQLHIIQGKVVDGLWDGTVNSSIFIVDNSDGHEWQDAYTYTCDGGIYESLGKEDNIYIPYDTYIISRSSKEYDSTSGTTEGQGTMVVTKEQLEETHGVIDWADDSISG